MLDIDIFNVLTNKMPKDQVLCNEPMKKHTSFRVGGNADYYVIAKNIDEVKFVLETARQTKTPITVVGNGTNLLVRDKGVRGIVLRPKLEDVDINGSTIKVGAGALLTLVSKLASDNGLSGLEFAYGIPGTIGGAIRMNAGAYGGEMKDVVVETTYMTMDGQIITTTNHEFEYRNSVFARMNVIILETVIKLKNGQIEEIKDKMKQYMESRKNNQPLEMPNAGSTFKRGDGFITAKLIDEAGLKGYHIGDAEVSTKHAGFIVNKGNATAKDILELVEYVKQKVQEKFDKKIELEIIVIGEK